jgi:tetratricopeptide (TPR) repeat protein
MPIRRPRGPKPTLRHLPFLEAMATSEEGKHEYREARATFLALRHLDHWIALGAGGGAPTDRSTTITQEALGALGDDTELRSALESIVSAIPELSDADAQPVLPRVFALGSLLERRGRTRQAADVYATVVRHVDTSAHVDLAYDANMRMAASLRTEGQLDLADQAYAMAGTLAARTRDRVRVITSRVGRAKVTWVRGNLPATDDALQELEQEARAEGAVELVAMILHDRAALSNQRGDTQRAIRTVWDAYRLSPDEYDRERMLEDLAMFLGVVGAFDAARDALQLIELGSRQQSARWIAQINLMELAHRTGNQVQFHQYRRALEQVNLPIARRVAYLLDAGRGLATFGELSGARAALTDALRTAETHGLNQKVFEAEKALADLAERGEAAAARQRSTTNKSATHEDAPNDIKAALRALVQEVAPGVPA